MRAIGLVCDENKITGLAQRWFYLRRIMRAVHPYEDGATKRLDAEVTSLGNPSVLRES